MRFFPLVNCESLSTRRNSAQLPPGVGDAKKAYTKSDSAGAARICYRGVYSRLPTSGHTGPEAESGVYDCLLLRL